MTDAHNQSYTLVREGSESPTRFQCTHANRADFYDRMYYLFHRLGIQSNIILSARYSPSHGNGKLQREHVFAALKEVIAAHPALSVVAVRRPTSKRGKHNVHVAILHRIDIAQCVEFLDDEEQGARFLEKVHNEWEWLEDEPTKPWWKVYVLGGREVVFVYHHLICDGLSGMTFHRTFIKALNAIPPDGPLSTETVIARDPSKVTLFPLSTTIAKHKPNVLEVLYTALKFLLLRVIFRMRVLFADLPPAKPYLKSVSAVATPEQRTVTLVASARIDGETMAAVVEACRRNNTTFVPLLAVAILVTFAVDIFPEAWFGCSCYAYGIAKYLRMPKLEGVHARDGLMVNAASAGHAIHRLQPYRNAMADGGHTVDKTVAWGLVREYGEDMKAYMPHRGMRTWIGCTQSPPDLEGFISQAMPFVGHLQSMVFQISSLGAFEAGEAEEPEARPAWRIDDCQFSAPAMNGNIDCHGFKFQIAGVKGGDTVINLSSEEGVVSREVMQRVLDLTVEKIKAMV